MCDKSGAVQEFLGGNDNGKMRSSRFATIQKYQSRPTIVLVCIRKNFGEGFDPSMDI